MITEQQVTDEARQAAFKAGKSHGVDAESVAGADCPYAPGTHKELRNSWLEGFGAGRVAIDKV